MNEDMRFDPDNPLSEDNIVWVEIEKGNEKAFHLIFVDTTEDGETYAAAVPADDTARAEDKGLNVTLFRMAYNEETGKDEIVPPYLDEDASISLQVRVGEDFDDDGGEVDEPGEEETDEDDIDEGYVDEDVFTIFSEKGEKMTVRMLDMIPYEDHFYAVLAAIDEDGVEEEEIMIFETVCGEGNGRVLFNPPDEKISDAVAELFNAKESRHSHAFGDTSDGE